MGWEMRSLKFIVNSEEESKKVQDFIFNLGGGWLSLPSDEPQQEYRFLDKPFIHVIVATYFNDDMSVNKQWLEMLWNDKALALDKFKVKTVNFENIEDHINWIMPNFA